MVFDHVFLGLTDGIIKGPLIKSKNISWRVIYKREKNYIVN